jgi:tRNA threonylcarbamoyl adenosine modification protein YeaZ
MLVLGIETSGIICGVSWVNNGQIYLEYRIEQPKIHTQLLADLVKRGFEQLGKSPHDVDLVSIASGPGSFTGLRIGMAYAKGMAYALDIPIIAVSNFEVLSQYAPRNKFPIYSVIDARRENYYLGIFNKDKYRIDNTVFCNRQELTNYLSKKGTIITTIYNFDDIIDPEFDVIITSYNATSVAISGETKYKSGQEVSDIDQLEPMYLRKFAGAD